MKDDTLERKRIALELLDTSLSVKTIAKIMKVSESTIYRWSNEWKTAKQILNLQAQLSDNKKMTITVTDS